VANQAARTKVDFEEAQKIVHTPFPQQAELDSKSQRLETLTEQLNLEAIERKKHAPQRAQTHYFDRAKLKKEAMRIAKQPKRSKEPEKKQTID